MGYKFNPTTGGLDVVSDPGGSDTQIQFNDAGSFGGDVDLTWNKTTNVMTVAGDLTLDDGVAGPVTTLQTITPTQNNTISLPNATGTVALVAGSSGQLLYNNAGANAGVSTMTFDGTSVTLAGRLINSYTSVASSPAKVFTGTWFTGGTATTTKPHFLIEPTGTTSTAWSTSGTGLGVNAASGFAGNLLDLQLNGTSRVVATGAGRVGIGTTSVDAILHTSQTTTGIGTGLILENKATSGSVTSCQAIWKAYDGSSVAIIGGVSALSSSWSFGTYTANSFNILSLKSGGIHLRTPNAPIVFSNNGSDVDNVGERARIDSSGRLLVGTSTNTGGSLLQVNDNRIRIATAKTPASATDTGSAGEICWDDNYIYVCTATNTWKRAALATW